MRTGPPERAHWREQELPELLVVAAPATVPGDLSGLERLLGFMRALPQPARGPLPALYVEGAAGLPPAALASSLIDDRPLRSCRPLAPTAPAQRRCVASPGPVHGMRKLRGLVPYPGNSLTPAPDTALPGLGATLMA